MSTDYQLARGLAEFELDVVEHSFEITARQMRERDADPGWIARVALMVAFETMIGLPPEEQLEFLEYADEVVSTMRGSLET